MKLLQIGPYPPPVGGWSFHIKVFRKYLDARGIENRVLNTGPNRRELSVEYVDVQNGLDYVRKVIDFCRQQYRIYIHLNGDSVKGFALTLLAQLIALAFRRRCCLSFHAGTIQVCFYPRWTLQKPLAFLCFVLADGIMCNSEEVKEKIVGFHIAPRKVHAIPCFSMQYLEHQEVLGSREESFIQEHSPIISSYLFFREEYEPETIIRALALIREHHPRLGCVMIGSIAGSEKYLDLAESLELDDHLLLVGDKEHDNFLTLVERSDVAVRAHMRDGVCSSVMEALALGVPVVACDNGTRPEEVILFESQNSIDLAKKVLVTLKNLEFERQRLSKVQRRDAIAEELAFLQSLEEPQTAPGAAGSIR